MSPRLHRSPLAFRFALSVLLLVGGCGTHTTGPKNAANVPRTYRMGFSDFPPRPTDSAVAAAVSMWIPRADAAILQEEPPWTALLAGASPDSLVTANELPVVNYYRSHGLVVVFETDVTNGINRSAEAPALDSAGRSIAEPSVQLLYRQWVQALVAITHPDYLGLASETNLIRAAAAPAVYGGVVQMTNAAAGDLAAGGSHPPLYVSVQVETAWGRLAMTDTGYIGVARDLTDFPFIQLLGLSSYPYLGQWTDPATIPLDYFARLVQGVAGRTPPPVLVTEGGWASASAGTFTSTPALQARWIAHESALLDSARAVAWFQLDFTDIDLAAYGLTGGTQDDATIALFATIGLVDTNLNPKPALAVWDSTFHRRYAP